MLAGEPALLGRAPGDNRAVRRHRLNGVAETQVAEDETQITDDEPTVQ
jgi:hypothetical protein